MNCAQSKDFITACLTAKLVPFLRGSPGIGKSSIVAEIAKEYGLMLIDFRLSQAEPCDLNGFPMIDPKTGMASYVPMDIFPIASTPLPTYVDAAGVTQTYNGWLLFLDEFNSASLAVQKATYKITLDRKVGQHDLHPKVAIVCAGNKETDNAITSRLSTAMQSRLIHGDLDTDVPEWLDWAGKAHIDYRITSFISFNNDILNQFKADHPDRTFPCQRTWEFVSRLISKIPTLDNTHVSLISGAIGEGAAREFIGFTRVYQDLPSIADILNSPNSAKIPTEPSSIYAVTGLLANNASIANIAQIVTYTSRLPTEFTVLTFKDAMRRNPVLIDTEVMQDWIAKNYNDVV